MNDLRKQVIKVAYDNPGEVRDALLPLLLKIRVTPDSTLVRKAVGDPTSSRTSPGPWPELTNDDRKVLGEIAWKYNKILERLSGQLYGELRKLAGQAERHRRAVLQQARQSEDPVTQRKMKSLADVLRDVVKQATAFAHKDTLWRDLSQVGQADYEARWMLDPFHT